MSNPILTIRNLEKTFETTHSSLDILKNVSFDVHEEEILVVTGASGVGKSTLLHLLGGLDRPTKGEINFKNRNLSHLNSQTLARFRNQEIGFVFQFHHLLPEFNAMENVAMPLLMGRKSRKEALEVSVKMLNAVGLDHRKTHRPGQLSGGEQQRVALARAMVTQPSLILADEPTGNLDEDTSEDVFELICNLNSTWRVTFVIATHNIGLAERAHRWLKLTDGRVETEKINSLRPTKKV